MTDVLLSIPLLSLLWSWDESSSHTEFVQHCKKKKHVKNWFDLKSLEFQLHSLFSFTLSGNKKKNVIRWQKKSHSYWRWRQAIALSQTILAYIYIK